MSIVEKFGHFLIRYESQIGIGLVVLAVLAGVILLIWAAVNAAKKRQLLSQIHDTVTEINSAVNSLGERKSDVIYIDNRASKQQADAAAAAVQEYSQAEAVRKEDSDAEKTAETAEAVAAAEMKETAEPETTGQEEPAQHQTEAALEIPKKYFSRDCSISKNGKTYTVEELERQIQE